MTKLARVSPEVFRPIEGGAASILKQQIEAARPDVATRKWEALLLLLDSSGSMSTPSRGGSTAWRELLRAVHALVQVSDPSVCMLGAAVFAGEADLVGKFSTDYAAMEESLAAVHPIGGTGVVEALTLAREIEWPPNAVRRVVLLSDGMPTTGNPMSAARQLAALDVTIDTVACGSGADDVTLQAIAAAGKGTFVQCDHITELRQVFRMLETKTRGLLGTGK